MADVAVTAPGVTMLSRYPATAYVNLSVTLMKVFAEHVPVTNPPFVTEHELIEELVETVQDVLFAKLICQDSCHMEPFQFE